MYLIKKNNWWKQVIGLMLMLFAVQLTSAQVRSSAGISGIVVEKGGSLRISEVNVTNLRTQRKALTNTFGVFIIEASPGDSLSFTKIGYGPVKTLLYTSEDILIEMQAGLTLETVVVSRKSREAEMRDMMDDYTKKGVYNNGKNKVGTYLNSPATALYNLFGRDAKNAKRFAKVMDQELEETQVDKLFNKTSVGALTNLTGDELQSFMDLYRPSFSAVQYWGQYDLMNYVKTSLATWEKNGRPQSHRLPKIELPAQER